MALPRTFSLTDVAQAELRQLRARAPQPYLRERATALLVLAAGQSARHVALHGLYRPRRPETVSAWRDRYLADGVAGLRQHPRRKRRLPP